MRRGQAKAGVITGLFNTGVDAGGTPLPDGTIGDPHYTLTSVPGDTTDIRVRTSVGGYPVSPSGPWLGDDAVSAWIGPNNDQFVDGPVGIYTYHTSFTLSSAGPVTITGRWSTDDPGLDILLDGASTGNTSASYTVWSPFSFTVSGVGVHTLDFLVDNSGGGPTGLRVEFATPEPATMTMLGIGIAGLAGYGWRRRKQQAAGA